MIDFLITFGAVAESRTLVPGRPFNDSQDCLTFLKRQLESFGRLRITPGPASGSGPPAPWRSL